MWIAAPTDTKLLAGHDYAVVIQVNVPFNQFNRKLIDNAVGVTDAVNEGIKVHRIIYIHGAPGFPNRAFEARVEFTAGVQGKMLEAGLDGKTIGYIISAIIFAALVTTGTLKQFFVLADTTVNKVFNPVTLVIILAIAVVIMGGLKK